MLFDELEFQRLVLRGIARVPAIVTHDEAVPALGELEPDPEVIEALRSRLAEHGVDLESEESDVAALLHDAPDLMERRQRDRQQAMARESARGQSTGAGTSDPVRMYLREIGRVPLLTGPEERELAALIKAGAAAVEELNHLNASELAATEATLAAADSDASDLTATDRTATDRTVADLTAIERSDTEGSDTAETANPQGLEPVDPARRLALKRVIRKGAEAREELTQANLRLVVSIAKRYASTNMPLLDLVQEGNLGLMRAVEKFDGEKGFKFSTYATWWIRQAITRAIADQSRTIRIPVHMVEAMNRVLRTKLDLAQRLEREPSIEELSAATDLPVDRVEELLRIAVDPLSLDMPMNEESDASLGDRVQDENAASPAAVAEMAMLHEAVDEALSDLAPRERELLRMRFGLDDGQPRTLEEVARSFNVTRERVRQIETKTLLKLGHSDHGLRLIDYLES
jgi:RNA polymerase primary sigma factor